MLSTNTSLNSSILPVLDNDDLGDIGMWSGDDDYAFYYEGDIDNLRKPWVTEPHFVPIIVVYGLAILVGLVGNALVIFAMVGDRRYRSVTASFMVSLAVADLLFVLVCVPYESARYFIGHWSSGSAFCKLSGLVEMLSAMASVLNLIAVSVERYVVIVHPMKARSWCTVENTKKILPCVWVIAFALSAPTLYIWDIKTTIFYQNTTSVYVVMCADIAVANYDRLLFSVYQLNVMLVLPVLVLTFCYVFVIRALWLSSRQLLQMTARSGSSGLTSMDSVYTTVYAGDEPAADGQAGTMKPPSTPNQSSCSHRQSCMRLRRSTLNRPIREHSAEVFRARKQTHALEHSSSDTLEIFATKTPFKATQTIR
ncbi:class a rhodopsin G-protein coupled receptor gprals [Plakobranchus ocellatus]|uniref:Class a rhodopsin G-protein coupled receptor gprals n=1 Tax=Plakobranchus ocellatus TaxID=259542 RepID=A0AAV4D963_9GAST|nr:class a rhodopsin G-protein coupled receptor gprals [Plakobranchus ocellatus]